MFTKQLIGRGKFTRAYRLPNGRVELHSTDVCKEALCEWVGDEFDLLPHLTLKETNYGTRIYETEYLERVSSPKKQLNTHDYDLYKQLVAVQTAFRSSRMTPCWNDYDNYSTLYNLFSSISSTFPAETGAVLAWLDACANYSVRVMFEISPRNIKLRGGRLVLADVFFILGA